MQEMGAENVLISLAAEGAVLLGGDDVLCGEAPRGEAFRSAGAGDAMLAGAAAGWRGVQVRFAESRRRKYGGYMKKSL